MMILSGLVDVRAENVDNPPTDQELGRIAAGSLVKICRNDERFWVLVTKVLAKRVVGKVDNHLVYNKDLPAGTEVAFEKRHIYDIDTVDESAKCDECGEPLGDQDEFNRRADLITEALEGIEDPWMEFQLISLAASSFLSAFDAKLRKTVRRDLIKCIDDDTKDMVVRACDA